MKKNNVFLIVLFIVGIIVVLNMYSSGKKEVGANIYWRDTLEACEYKKDKLNCDDVTPPVVTNNTNTTVPTTGYEWSCTRPTNLPSGLAYLETSSCEAICGSACTSDGSSCTAYTDSSDNVACHVEKRAQCVVTCDDYLSSGRITSSGYNSCISNCEDTYFPSCPAVQSYTPSCTLVEKKAFKKTSCGENADEVSNCYQMTDAIYKCAIYNSKLESTSFTNPYAGNLNDWFILSTDDGDSFTNRLDNPDPMIRFLYRCARDLTTMPTITGAYNTPCALDSDCPNSFCQDEVIFQYVPEHDEVNIYHRCTDGSWMTEQEYSDRYHSIWQESDKREFAAYCGHQYHTARTDHITEFNATLIPQMKCGVDTIIQPGEQCNSTVSCNGIRTGQRYIEAVTHEERMFDMEDGSSCARRTGDPTSFQHFKDVLSDAEERNCVHDVVSVYYASVVDVPAYYEPYNYTLFNDSINRVCLHHQCVLECYNDGDCGNDKICVNQRCQDLPCKSVTCPNYCSNGIEYTDGFCSNSNGQCSYSSVACNYDCNSSSCSLSAPEVITCTDLTWSPLLSSFCTNETVNQTSNCNTIRQRFGTKSCAIIPVITPVNITSPVNNTNTTPSNPSGPVINPITPPANNSNVTINGELKNLYGCKAYERWNGLYCETNTELILGLSILIGYGIYVYAKKNKKRK